jgi:hypothetical protein
LNDFFILFIAPRHGGHRKHGLSSVEVCLNQSQSHIATDGQSVSKSWCRAPCGAHDHIFITIWQSRSCFFFCGAPSLTRGWVCLLYKVLALANAVFLGSEALGTSDHILLSQIWGFLFRRLLRLAGSRWRPWPQKSKSKSHCDWRSVSQSVNLSVEPHVGLMTCYLLLFDSYGLVFVARPLWREDGSVFCICCWPLPWPESESESYVTTDGQSASLSWNKAPIWGSRSDLYYCQTVAGLLMWGALSDETTDLSFTIAASPRQRSHSRVRVPWDSRLYFTVLYLRLPFSSPPTTRSVTVEVFDPASTRITILSLMLRPTVSRSVCLELLFSKSKSKSKWHCDWRSVIQ